VTVGYYVHHAGAGHGALGSALGAVLDDELVGVGSGGRPAAWRGRWIDLPRDDDPPVAGDPTRGGAWHWVPEGHPGFGARMQAFAAWVAGDRPSALVVDVSCEVAVLGGLLGVPTVAVLLAGRRDDRPHRLAWDTATALAAPLPAVGPWAEPWREKVAPLGLVSRFDARPAPPPPTGRRVLVLLPSGGHAVTRTAVEAAAAATPAWTWTVAGEPPSPTPSAPPPEPVIRSGGFPPDPITGSEGVRWVGRVDDPWELLAEATVVVAAAGLGSVADVAAARRPAVLLPQHRPFGEQRALAATVADGPVVVADRWPAAAGWPALLDRAAGLDPAHWDALHDRCGAERFAALVTRVSSSRPAESGRGCCPTAPAPSGPNPTPPAGRSATTSTPTSWSSAVASPA
jgi:hypothetical protein